MENLNDAIPTTRAESTFGYTNSIFDRLRVSNLYDLLSLQTNINPTNRIFFNFGYWVNFKELKAKVDNFAINFGQMGMNQNSLLAINLPNCFQLYITLYACHKLGIPVLLVNPAYKATEVMHLLLRSKATAYLGLKGKTEYEMSLMVIRPSLQAIILTDFVDEIPNRKGNQYCKEMEKLYHNDPEKVISDGYISYIQMTKPSTYPIIEPDVYPDSIAILIESMNKDGQQHFAAFTHFNIIKQVEQLTFILENCDHDNPCIDFTSRDLGFIGILPSCTSFGVIINNYLPLYLTSCSLLFSDFRGTGDMIKTIQEINDIKDIIFVGFDLLIKRFCNYVQNYQVKQKYLSKFSLVMSCNEKMDEYYHSEFEKITQIPLIETIGSLEMPFIFSKNRKKIKTNKEISNDRVILSENWRLLGETEFLIIDNEEKPLNYQDWKLAPNNTKGKIWVKGPQLCHRIIPSPFHSLHDLTAIKQKLSPNLIIDRNNQSWYYTGYNGMRTNQNQLIISSFNPNYIKSGEFRIFPQHIMHLYEYYSKIHAVEEIQVEPVLESNENNGNKKHGQKNSPSYQLRVKLKVSNPNTFSIPSFLQWAKDTILFYKNPIKVIFTNE